MRTSEPGTFRRRQALADLNRQRRAVPLATARRIGAGLGLRSAGAPDLPRRLEWYFSGKAPVAELRRDSLVHGALLMASALPEDDFGPFVAATILLLLERLGADDGKDDGFWNWARLVPHYRLAADPARAAIMCGFREARRLGRITLDVAPGPGDCLTRPRDGVLAMLAEVRGVDPLLAAVEEAVAAETGARDAGDLWTSFQAGSPGLPEAHRRAAECAFRYLYERPLSMDPEDQPDLPLIPLHDRS